MNYRSTWLAAALLLCPLAAQEGEAPAVDAQTRLEQLEVERGKILSEWRAAMKKQAEEAKNNPNRPPARVIALRPDYSALCAKFMAGADQYPDAAVQFLMPALSYSSKPEQYREVIDRLLDNHLDSPDLSMLGGYLARLERMVDADYAAAVVAKIEKHGKNLPLLGWVAFNRHQNTFRDQSPSSDVYQNAKTLVANAVGKAEDQRLQRMFDQLITETEKFGIGMVAPDIVGPDLDDVVFKLSDYKGKVIFLDFWGDW